MLELMDYLYFFPRVFLRFPQEIIFTFVMERDFFVNVRAA